ncbi:uncharacterized protein LTR77_003045 [Saxophila tyrrhenica]|uniref:Carboxylic ester hydrolase n=1 Tax=Saxophila tyrrhenica TaxID=1690608 RepID=A0AAV9PKS6_9PEZI|nr:hypothetical protein LTR77_003045 [Saxophila tyrrhenica]
MASFISKAALLTVAWTKLLQPVFAAPSKSSLPIVDLGYERHQAAYQNSTGNYYSFSNIRYAAPPVGDLRFRAPQPPKRNRGEVQTGEQDRICPQAQPAWGLISGQFIPEYLAGQTEFNSSSFNTSTGSGGLPQVDSRTTEDCLFLDVVVPKGIFDNVGKGSGAPVLVWIYGGGYTAGEKSGGADPAGLIRRSTNKAATGVIYVSMNYRLGAFGWLSGPSLQADGTANAGLHDQRFALEWIQKNIKKFGGDPSRVTVFGESAGGGSIMHQMTAYGGRKPVPFNQVVPQSPGFLPIVSNQQQEQTLNDFLALANVSTIAEARKLSFTQLLIANTIQVGLADYGGFVYGPTVDGDFVPATPGELFLHGEYAKNLKVMVGHNANEGLLFTSPFIQNNTAFRQYLLRSLPTLRAWPSVTKYITKTLYPPVFDGSQAQGYTDQIGRASAVAAELSFTCNTFYLDKAYNNQTYSYFFTVPPALHGQDIAYTYYNGPDPENVQNPQIAIALQEYITSFAMDGNPNERGVPHFPMYGDDATVQVLNATGISQLMDPTANYRCNWWQKALYA